MSKEFDRTVIEQTLRFFNAYYRFPHYIAVGALKVQRDAIVEAVERHLDGRPLQWHRRSKLIGQLNDALHNLETDNELLSA
jgi:hypothetical protein